VSYCRVSSSFQKEKQLSVPAQQRECRDHAFRRGGLLLREFTDEAISGETLERPGLQALLDWARAGAAAEAGATLDRVKDKDTGKRRVLRNAHLDAVLVWKLDRLSRPDEDLDYDFLLIRRELRLAGVRIESATEAYVEGDEPMARLMSYLGRGQTGMEAEERKNRFRLGREGAARDQGRQNGPPPYGYDWKNPDGGSRAEVRKGRPWAPIEPAASWLRMIFTWCLAGETVVGIVRRLNAHGAPPPSQSGDGGRRGGAICRLRQEWTHDTVHRILRNRRYAGFIWLTTPKGSYGKGSYAKPASAGEWIDVRDKPQGHEPLVTLETWERAQEILTGRGRGRRAGGTSLFCGGILRCPRCAARGEDVALTVVSQPQRCYRVDGSYVTHTYTSYTCYAHVRNRRERSWGAVPREDCGGYQIGQKKIMDLLTAYLARLARGVEAGGAQSLDDLRARAEALRPRLPDPAQGREARRAELTRQLAQIPEMETNLQMQQAMGFMDMAKLGAMLADLAKRGAGLREALEALGEDKAAPAIAPIQAAYLLRLLQDEDAGPLAKRDVLNALIARIVPGLDRKSLRVHLKER